MDNSHLITNHHTPPCPTVQKSHRDSNLGLRLPVLQLVQGDGARPAACHRAQEDRIAIFYVKVDVGRRAFRLPFYLHVASVGKGRVEESGYEVAALRPAAAAHQAAAGLAGEASDQALRRDLIPAGR